MNYHSIYQTEAPEFLRALCRTPPMARLREIGMNCGCEYTAFPRFAGIERYTRFEHSLGAALIVWRFTSDAAQSVSALLHDVATPVFAHVVDFLRGDYLSQTATESGTASLIRSSAEIGAVLRELGLRAEDVEDYHRYPVADNDPPRLSADRLDYTLGNAVNFGLASVGELTELFSDLRAGENEFGETELIFSDEDRAARFSDLALACSRIYVCDADRCAMQALAELLRDALAADVLAEEDLSATEERVIAKLCADERFARRIDPYVARRGRVSALFPERGAAIEAFLNEDIMYFVRGE